MTKIALVIPSLQSGGMERVMSELAKYFIEKKGAEVHLILYGKKRSIFFSIPADIKIHIPSFVFTDDQRLINTLKTLLFLRRTIKKIQPDTILSFGEYWNNFVLLALLGVKIPIFISDRCKPDKFLGGFQELLRKWLYPAAAGIIAQTSRAREIYREQDLNKNIRVIGNPIYQVSSNGESVEKEDIVLTVGRLIKTKNHDRLINIFSKFSSVGWRLVIVGGDALKQKGTRRLKKLVEELNMEEAVEFTGTVSDIETYYKKSKIFAFTSSSEGFPNVIGEAMSAGLPVIAYNCPAGPSDLIDDEETGYLIPLYDDVKFGEKLSQLMHDAELRSIMGSKALKKIRQFQTDAIAEAFYLFILDSHKSTSSLVEAVGSSQNSKRHLYQTMKYSGLLSWLKELISSNAFFYKIWFYSVRKWNGDYVRLPSIGDDFYFDGYPRSGNTFFGGLLRKVYPQKKFASHLHVIAGLKIALALDLPIFVMVRRPEDAVISNLYRIVRDKKTPISDDLIEMLLISYFNYYLFVKKNRARIHTFKFESCINNELSVVQAIADGIGSKKKSSEYLSQILNEFKILMQRKEAQKDSYASSLPNDNRARFKRENINRILNSRSFGSAINIYGEVIKYDLLSKRQSRI